MLMSLITSKVLITLIALINLITSTVLVAQITLVNLILKNPIKAINPNNLKKPITSITLTTLIISKITAITTIPLIL